MKVQVGFSRMAGISAFADLLSGADGVTHGHSNAAQTQMGEKTKLVLPMLDQDVVSTDVAAPHVHFAGTREPIVPLPILGAHDDAVGWREDRLTECGKVGEASAFQLRPTLQGFCGFHEIVRVTLIRYIPGMRCLLRHTAVGNQPFAAKR